MNKRIIGYLLISCLLLFQNLIAQIDHVEPLNWFIGMKNPRVQLLVNGADIGTSTPIIQYPGVTIEKVHRANSKQYLFIDLYIQPSAKPGTLSIRFEKNGKTIATYPYTLLARKQDPNQFKGFN